MSSIQQVLTHGNDNTQQLKLARAALPHVSRLLSQHHAASKGAYRLRLQDDDADLPVPQQALALFAEILRAMASGQSVQVIAADSLLTTQQAADFLHVSRTHLLKLIERGELPISKTGTHRRLALNDVIAYKQERQTDQRARLQAMAELDRDLEIDDL